MDYYMRKVFFWLFNVVAFLSMLDIFPKIGAGDFSIICLLAVISYLSIYFSCLLRPSFSFRNIFGYQISIVAITIEIFTFSFLLAQINQNGIRPILLSLAVSIALLLVGLILISPNNKKNQLRMAYANR